jgi:hypothetical protein
MAMSQLALLEDVPADPLKEQWARLPDETHVLMDYLFAQGWAIDVTDSDFDVETRRLHAARAVGLVRATRVRNMSGRLRAGWLWGRRIRPEDSYGIRRLDRHIAYVAVERKRERQLFDYGKRTKPANWRDMTSAEVELVMKLGRCNLGPGSQKTFVRDMVHRAIHTVHPLISEKQATWLASLALRFRKQLAAQPQPEKHP